MLCSVDGALGIAAKATGEERLTIGRQMRRRDLAEGCLMVMVVFQLVYLDPPPVEAGEIP